MVCVASLTRRSHAIDTNMNFERNGISRLVYCAQIDGPLNDRNSHHQMFARKSGQLCLLESIK